MRTVPDERSKPMASPISKPKAMRFGGAVKTTHSRQNSRRPIRRAAASPASFAAASSKIARCDFDQLAKDAEDAAKDDRLTAELQILAELGKPDDFKGYVKLEGVSVAFGESVKVDTEGLQLLANDSDHETINHLFRWKAELKSKEWKEADEETRRHFSRVLSIKPTKPAFTRHNDKKETK
jgi:hypothetical protein